MKLINEEGMPEAECLPFAISIEIMDVDDDHKWSQKE